MRKAPPPLTGKPLSYKDYVEYLKPEYPYVPQPEYPFNKAVAEPHSSNQEIMTPDGWAKIADFVGFSAIVGDKTPPNQVAWEVVSSYGAMGLNSYEDL